MPRRERATRSPASTYEIAFRGVLPQAARRELSSWTLSIGPLESLLVGEVHDQAELHGVLDRLATLGLALVEVRRRPPTPDQPDQPAPAAG